MLSTEKVSQTHLTVGETEAKWMFCFGSAWNRSRTGLQSSSLLLFLLGPQPPGKLCTDSEARLLERSWLITHLNMHEHPGHSSRFRSVLDLPSSGHLPSSQSCFFVWVLPKPWHSRCGIWPETPGANPLSTLYLVVWPRAAFIPSACFFLWTGDNKITHGHGNQTRLCWSSIFKFFWLAPWRPFSAWCLELQKKDPDDQAHCLAV